MGQLGGRIAGFAFKFTPTGGIKIISWQFGQLNPSNFGLELGNRAIPFRYRANIRRALRDAFPDYKVR